jgi:hypothetical protein
MSADVERAAARQRAEVIRRAIQEAREAGDTVTLGRLAAALGMPVHRLLGTGGPS